MFCLHFYGIRGILTIVGNSAAGSEPAIPTDKTEEFYMKITKDTLIGDALEMDIELAQFFFEIGMHCLGCPASRGETI